MRLFLYSMAGLGIGIGLGFLSGPFNSAAFQKVGIVIVSGSFLVAIYAMVFAPHRVRSASSDLTPNRRWGFVVFLGLVLSSFLWGSHSRMGQIASGVVLFGSIAIFIRFVLLAKVK